jgi:alkanesulfonate monooxygenase SsuD/methylene tetrahydromethanopterin reductase-like flavin-dependent oxidoreductase (luciferase family)
MAPAYMAGRAAMSNGVRRLLGRRYPRPARLPPALTGRTFTAADLLFAARTACAVLAGAWPLVETAATVCRLAVATRAERAGRPRTGCAVLTGCDRA